MVELQETIPALDEAGIAAYAISYDSVETIEEFATSRGITFSLLSDVGSIVIRRLGLLNLQVQRQHQETHELHEQRFEGVPYPMTFLLDRDGNIIDRRFDEDYRIRESARAILAGRPGFQASAGSHHVALGDVAAVTVAVESDRYSPFQKIWFDAEVVVAPGWHIYGSPSPSGLCEFAVTTTGSEVIRPGDVELRSKPVLRRVAGGHQPVPTLEGKVEARFSVVVATSWKLEIYVNGTVDFQACNDMQCLPPQSIPWSLRLLPRVYE